LIKNGNQILLEMPNGGAYAEPQGIRNHQSTVHKAFAMKTGSMDERFKEAMDHYNKLTGANETNQNAIMHHRIELYGPDCERCGKPYRSPKASFCAACGHKRNQRKLFLDDLRTIDMVYPPSSEAEFDIVRSYIQFVEYLTTKGLPTLISFDNDLGLDESGDIAPDGYAAAKWLVYESGIDLRDFEFKVHSANPIAAAQIRGLLNNYINHLRPNG
jgi:hypothetical protein